MHKCLAAASPLKATHIVGTSLLAPSAEHRFLIHDRHSKFSADFDEVERERARKRALSSCLER